MRKKFVALLPIRGGSKSIPKKNIKPLCGKPLFQWSLQAAIESQVFDEIYVSSDSNEILDSVKKIFPNEVILLKRSTHLSEDTTSTEAVLLDFSKDHQFDVLCTIQATSPLTTAQNFIEAKEKFLSDDFDSLVTCTKQDFFIWSPQGKALNYDPQNRPRRQDFEGTLCENGAFYFTNKKTLLDTKCRLGLRPVVHTMSSDTFYEIDEPNDWLIVEKLLSKRNQLPTLKHQSIQALIIDIDGTMTDGGMYYSESGETLKKFNTKDAQGISNLRSENLKVAIITGEDSPSVTSRMKKLNIEDYHKGVKNKVPVLMSLAQKWGLKLSEIAYIGDDIGDLECMKLCGLTFCPSDSVPEIKNEASHICSLPGGLGAVREACDLILNKE